MTRPSNEKTSAAGGGSGFIHAMRTVAAILALGLLVFPLLRHASFSRRLESADSSATFLSTLLGVSSGLAMSCLGLMILGVVVDAGKGCRHPALFVAMIALGAAWCAIYPAGWLPGVPLIVYPLARWLGPGKPGDTRATTQSANRPTPPPPAPNR